jgi:hypothetical protein
MSAPYKGPYNAAVMDAAFARILGDQALIAPIKLFAGTRTAPGLTFGAEPTSGLYRAAAGDIRLSVLDQDIAFFGKLSGSAALGIGVAPTAGSLHIKRDFAGAAAGAAFENNDPTDLNTTTLDFRGTTTGAGGAANQQFGAITVEQTTHDNATKASKVTLSWALAGSMRFFDLSGDGILARRNGNIEIQSAAGNGNVTLTPNGTGRVRINTDGLLATPAIAFTSETGMGIYRNASNDLRLAINGSDMIAMGFVTAAGATTAPSLGIGKFPLRGGLHILCNNSASTGTGIQLENNDATDGNATGFSCRVTTTGAGGAAMTEIGKFNCRCDLHDFATRTSHLDFNWNDNGTSMFIQFIGIGGVRGLRSDSGALTISTGGANANLNLLPNGTGQIILPNGAIATPSWAFTGETTMGMYRASAALARFTISSTDCLSITRLTLGGLTNQPSLGIGISTPAAPLHISGSGTTVGGDLFFSLDNVNATDGTGSIISWRTTTTGVGATVHVSLASITGKMATHNHATRSSAILITWTDSATARAFSFTGNSVVPDSNNTMDLGTTALGFRDMWVSRNMAFNLLAGLRYVAGTGQRCGDAVLVAGTVTVANTSVTANTRVLLSRKTQGAAAGFLGYTLSAGTSFTITSSNAGDTGTISYELIEVV